MTLNVDNISLLYIYIYIYDFLFIWINDFFFYQKLNVRIFPNMILSGMEISTRVYQPNYRTIPKMLTKLPEYR